VPAGRAGDRWRAVWYEDGLRSIARVVIVNRKVVEVRGLFVEAPKNRKWRRTIYPRLTPGGYPLAELVAARIAEVRQEQAAGRNPLGLMLPAPAGGCLRSSRDGGG
jgi:hypothetical protein